MEWQTLINLQAGTHIPYFPGMDWDKVERYEWQGLTGRQKGALIAREKAIEKGDKTRGLILDTLINYCEKNKYATVEDISIIVKYSYHHTSRTLRNLFRDGLISRHEMRDDACKYYLYFPI